MSLNCTITQLLKYDHFFVIYTVSRKKAATDFFAVTFTNADGFS